MSSGSYRQVYILCPYYRSDDGRHTITCEGLTANSTLRLQYGTKEDYEIQLKTFCERHYDNCEICRMLTELNEE